MPGRYNESRARIDARARNVSMDANGKRVVGPTSAQISGGTAPKSWYQSRARAAKVNQAREDGSFATKRFEYNQANAGRATMDSDGNIAKTIDPTDKFRGAPQPELRKSLADSAERQKQALIASKQPTAPEAPAKPPPSGPQNANAPAAPVVASTPTRGAYNPMAVGTIVDEGGDRTGAIARNLNASGKKPVESFEPKWKQRRKPIIGFRSGSTIASILNK